MKTHYDDLAYALAEMSKFSWIKWCNLRLYVEDILSKTESVVTHFILIFNAIKKLKKYNRIEGNPYARS
jgi:hypothetical protein